VILNFSAFAEPFFINTWVEAEGGFPYRWIWWFRIYFVLRCSRGDLPWTHPRLCMSTNLRRETAKLAWSTEMAWRGNNLKLSLSTTIHVLRHCVHRALFLIRRWIDCLNAKI
jgi:hypothetical protein